MYTLGVRADPRTRARAAGLGRRRAGAAPTGAATSPTTGPGQLVGYPILTLPPKHGRRERHGRHRGLRALGGAAPDRRAGRPRPARRRAPPRLPGRVGRPRRRQPAQDRRHRRAAQPGSHDARLRPQRHHRPRHVRPHRAVRHRRQGRSRRWRPRASTSRCARWSTPSSPAPPSGGAASVGRAPGRRLAGPARGPVAVQPGRGPGRAGPAARSRLGRRRGVTEGLAISERKPDWLRAKVHMGPTYLRLKKTMRELHLVTVCEDAGCPNIFECWADGTATFMINGERCTRACGFCLVDTRKPVAPDADEPERVAEAVARMGLGPRRGHDGGARRPRRRRRRRVRRDDPGHPPPHRRAPPSRC